MDLKDPANVLYLQKLFNNTGINNILKQMGIEQGQEICIGGYIFEFSS